MPPAQDHPHRLTLRPSSFEEGSPARKGSPPESGAVARIAPGWLREPRLSAPRLTPALFAPGQHHPYRLTLRPSSSEEGSPARKGSPPDSGGVARLASGWLPAAESFSAACVNPDAAFQGGDTNTIIGDALHWLLITTGAGQLLPPLVDFLSQELTGSCFFGRAFHDVLDIQSQTLCHASPVRRVSLVEVLDLERLDSLRDSLHGSHNVSQSGVRERPGA